MKRIGLIVNPVAGIGGKVGLKGSDGEAVYKEALLRGAVKESGQKALTALRALKAEELSDIWTCPGEMGAEICGAAGLSCRVISALDSGAEESLNLSPCGTGELRSAKYTTPEDTVRVARAFAEMDVDLILFAGGDGTARNIMDAVGTRVAVLGIPAGCKIHSGVFALNPRKAGELAAKYIRGKIRDTKEAEVMDIDEEQFREGRVQSRLYGYLRVPDESRMVQGKKSGSRYSEQGAIECLADYIADTWERDALYIVGGGSTTDSIMKKLGFPNTLLGVDMVYGGRVIVSDCTEQEILDAIEEHPTGNIRIIVTVIGGQGCIFGRGNQQISARVIRRVGRENILVAASPDKLLPLLGKGMYVDTGDEETDRYLSGYMRVLTGYGEYTVMKVSD